MRLHRGGAFGECLTRRPDAFDQLRVQSTEDLHADRVGEDKDRVCPGRRGLSEVGVPGGCGGAGLGLLTSPLARSPGGGTHAWQDVGPVDVDLLHRGDEGAQDGALDRFRTSDELVEAQLPADATQRRQRHADRSHQPLRPFLPGPGHQLVPDGVAGGDGEPSRGQELSELRQRELVLGQFRGERPAVEGGAGGGAGEKLEDALGDVERGVAVAGCLGKVGAHRVAPRREEFRSRNPV